jgi:hypothetical protein
LPPGLALLPSFPAICSDGAALRFGQAMSG